MTDPRERKAETEALFRELNERIAETAERFDAERVELHCECADPACHERVEAPLAEYEDVRAQATDFLVVPGHEAPEIERVVGRRRRYAVVRKVDGLVARIVRRLDPRGPRPSPSA